MTVSTPSPLVLSFDAIDASMLVLVGGKGANLGEMARAGLPVPPGYCVTTEAYARAARAARLDALLDDVAATPADDRARLERAAADVRGKVLAVAIPDDISAAITQAYQSLQAPAAGAPIPVAVRSSATAEDLPFASFAGQQDTYLNIVGEAALLDAVRRCWASLWTDRAVSYRAANAIDPRTVRLAVVVQQMVQSEVAGVLFTANPLTGHRHQAVIDASPGLGEAVVSGAVNPDHFVVNTTSGEIVERRLGDKRLVIRATAGGGTQQIQRAEAAEAFCLTDEQVRALAGLGARVEAHYGAPQDTEWAIDAAGQLWLTQARPITTLYPMPESALTPDDQLRVYLSASMIQGVDRPLTPMGIQTFRLLSSALTAFVSGKPPKHIEAGSPYLFDFGQRLFVDATPLLGNPLGRDVIVRVLSGMEAQSGAIFQQLAADPRLMPPTMRKAPTVRKLVPVALRTKVPMRVAGVLLRPKAARRRVAALEAFLRQPNQAKQAALALPPNANAAAYLDAYERRLMRDIRRLANTVLPLGFAGIASLLLGSGLLKRIATPDEIQTVLRALPHNPTTEMDLALWALAQHIRADAALVSLVEDTPAAHLAQTYRAGQLPPALQQGLEAFLATYGHRAVAEIDLGLPRWSEDPMHILGVLANYLRLTNPDLAPDVQFARGAREAEAMVKELNRRARRKGWFYRRRVHFLLNRIRALAGTREMPKFCIVLLLMRCRELLWPVGDELARLGRLDQPEDVFFLTLPEARAAVAGADQRALVRERRASYDQEMGRRHLPRVLLSDGTEPTAGLPAGATGELGDSALRGTPASAGRITARARVIRDPTGAQLEPGEILVAPSTDPGWTPLFMTAAGLVMEMGGSMSHGAVVAREYGIPAVVGVAGAVARIATGQRITVDGSNGVVIVEPEEA